MLRAPGARGRDLGAADRAEPRRGHRGGRHGRRDGQRPDRARDAGGASWRPTATCSSGSSAYGRRRRRRTARGAGGAGGAPIEHGRRSSPSSAPGTAQLPLDGHGAERAVRAFTRWNAADPGARTARPAARGARRATSRAVARRRRRRHAGGREARVVELPVAATAAAPPTSPAPSTPRARAVLPPPAASTSWGCARSPSTSRPPASRRRPWSIRARWRAITRGASGPCSPATAARRSPRWPLAFEHFIAHAPRRRRPHLGRRLGRHRAGHAGHAPRCRSACPR